uniref:Mitochondrial import receptor subunit TOM7 homolog n=1 Tax=Scleropages formosus TaxID=113540 RepID=A0A8C9TVA1_SCLFO
MAKLSKETKQRLQQVFQCGQFIIRWGFIPTVLYLGFKRGADPGMPEPTVLRYSLDTVPFSPQTQRVQGAWCQIL